MSLFKQVLISFIVLIFTILSVVIVLNVKNDRNFIEGQLKNNSDNIITSLSLALVEPVKNKDYILAETIMDSVYDSGYYSHVTLFDTEGKVILSKTKDIVVKDVPQWFIDSIEFNISASKSDIVVGWQNYGSIEIKNHTGYAYYKLWETFISLIQNILIITFVGIVAIFISLKFLLSSLAKIKKQAIAITQNTFIRNNDKPFTAEFRSVISAMNLMVDKVEEIFNKEVATLKKYNNLLYIDQDTGLENRNALNLKLKNYLNNSSGVFFLLEIKNDTDLKKHIGFNKYASLLKYIIQTIQNSDMANNENVFARINTGTFAIVLPNASYLNIHKTLNGIYKQILDYAIEQNIYDTFNLAIGVTDYVQKNEISKMLSRADKALLDAYNETNQIKIGFVKNDSITKTKQEWIELIEWAFANKGIKIGTQNIINSNDDSIYMQEFFSRIVDREGTVYYPGDYIPILKEMGWFIQFERHNINEILKYYKENNFYSGMVVINLSNTFAKDVLQMNWLTNELTNNFKNSSVVFHFSCLNSELIKNSEYYADVAKKMDSIGHKIGVDSFNFESSSFDYLKMINPSFIKISKSYLLDKNDISISSSSISSIATTLGSTLIVKHVEAEAEKEILVKNGFKLLQGYLMGKTCMLDN